MCYYYLPRGCETCNPEPQHLGHLCPLTSSAQKTCTLTQLHQALSSASLLFAASWYASARILCLTSVKASLSQRIRKDHSSSRSHFLHLESSSLNPAIALCILDPAPLWSFWTVWDPPRNYLHLRERAGNTFPSIYALICIILYYVKEISLSQCITVSTRSWLRQML